MGICFEIPNFMDYYRRLNDKDRKKLNFYRKFKRVTKTGIKWWFVGCGIVCIFAVGMVFLYKYIDGKKAGNIGIESFASNTLSGQNSQDTDGMNELSKKELEREDAKSESLDSKTDEKNEICETAKGNKNGKVYDFSSWNKTCSPEMIVINKDNPISENINVKTKACHGKEINVEAAESLDSMITEAKKQGIVLWISSGYRNMSLQTKLFNRRIEREKSKAMISDEEAAKRAAKVVAKPGTSEHNTGLAVDFNGVEDDFYKTKEYKWLMDNAHKYGFIERYQKKWKEYTGVIYEPWHFRYVGKEHATKIKESGLCLEKYVADYLIKK